MSLVLVLRSQGWNFPTVAPIIVAILWENQNKGVFYLGTPLENKGLKRVKSGFSLTCSKSQTLILVKLALTSRWRWGKYLSCLQKYIKLFLPKVSIFKEITFTFPVKLKLLPVVNGLLAKNYEESKAQNNLHRQTELLNQCHGELDEV